MVSEQDDLGALEVRVAGITRSRALAQPISGLGRVQQGADCRDRLTGPQAEVGRDLIVAAAGGVQATGGRRSAREAALDGHVDVFVGDVVGERPGLDLREDGAQPADDRIRIRGSMMPCLASIVAWAIEPMMSWRACAGRRGATH